jgi:NADH-quinone oxidoreductase subunit J
MFLHGITFYLFSAVLVFSALMVITARNPVHSVLFLILGFFNSAGLFVLLGAEFLAFILVIVYVGAVAVLFLFVVMMLDISFHDLRKGAMQYVPIGVLSGIVLLTELVMLYKVWSFAPGARNEGAVSEVSNAEALGNILYTDYIYIFQAAGIILLVAMIGAIVLTHRVRVGVRKQKVGDQFSTRASDVLDVKKVTSGSGV